MSSVSLLAFVPCIAVQHSFCLVHSSKGLKILLPVKRSKQSKVILWTEVIPLHSSPRVSKSCQPFVPSEVLRNINALFSLYLQFIGNTGLSPEA